MLRERRFDTGLFGLGDGLALVAGIVLAVSSFTGWYTGEGEGTTVSVVGWHTGTLGKVVLVLGLVAVLLVVLRELGVDLPSTVPESLLAIGIGSIATVLVLVRLISIPEEFFFASRGVGIWSGARPTSMAQLASFPESSAASSAASSTRLPRETLMR